SEAEPTAALCSLLQRSTQVVQIRFFINFLHQIVRADFVTTLLGPAVGGSMQSQMEAKLASMNLNSPGFESTLPGSLHPYLQHQRHELPVTCLRFFFPFHIPRYYQHCRQPKRRHGHARATARQQRLYSFSPSFLSIVYR
ncbi:hypothetical protein H4582DRAFT_1816371, partial [Lactarius indigo]